MKTEQTKSAASDDAAAAAAAQVKAAKNREKARVALRAGVGGNGPLGEALEQAVLAAVGGAAHGSVYRNAVRSVHAALTKAADGATKVEQLQSSALLPAALVKQVMISAS